MRIQIARDTARCSKFILTVYEEFRLRPAGFLNPKPYILTLAISARGAEDLAT